MKELLRAFGWTAVACVLGLWAYQSWWAQPEKQRKRSSERRIEASQRFENWAYVAKEKEVAPGETVKLIVIPSPLGIDSMDTKCFIYTHHEYRTSSMLCPDARQDDIQEDAWN